MPGLFPEMWQNRVMKNLNSAIVAPFVDGIPELDTAVVELGSGTATEKNIIHIPTSDFEPTVLVNNTTYPLALEEYTDEDVTISLDKYQSLPTNLSDDQIMGASYDRIDSATMAHSTAITAKKYKKAAHALAPTADSVATPMVLVLGNGTEASGERLRCTYESLVALKDACDKAGMPETGRRLVLCSDHWNDLLLDRNNFGDQLVNYNAGTVVPNICGFEIYKYTANPFFNATAKTKLPFTALPIAGQYQGSFVFVVSNTAKKTGITKQYFEPASADTQNQTNKVAYRHYFIVCPKRNQYLAALISKNKA
jgi:hypothetical protein